MRTAEPKVRMDPVLKFRSNNNLVIQSLLVVINLVPPKQTTSYQHRHALTHGVIVTKEDEKMDLWCWPVNVNSACTSDERRKSGLRTG